MCSAKLRPWSPLHAAGTGPLLVVLLLLGPALNLRQAKGDPPSAVDQVPSLEDEMVTAGVTAFMLPADRVPMRSVAGRLTVVLPAALDVSDRATQEPLSEESVSEDSVSEKPLTDEPLSESGRFRTKTLGDLAPPCREALGRSTLALRRRLAYCLDREMARRLNPGKDSGWSIMHSFLGGGVETRLNLDPRGRTTADALSWLAENRPAGGRRVLYLEEGRIRGRLGPGYQGHEGQLLAMFAQCDVPPSLPMTIDQQSFTVRDLVEAEMVSCRPGQELTFKLIGFAHYLDTEALWSDSEGNSWDLQRVIQSELSQPINGAACGGTHRMMGFAYAVACRRAEGRPLDGQWQRADKYVRDYQRYLFTLQNRDGSFSSEWFRGRAHVRDIDRQLQTTGHLLEWLVFSLPASDLQDARVVRAVDFLTNLMNRNQDHDWAVGPHGHAVRALRLYHRRVFGDDGRTDDSDRAIELAGRER